MTAVADYFDVAAWVHRALFDGVEHVWEALDRLPAYMAELVSGTRIEGTVMEGAFVQGAVYVGPGAVIEPGALVMGPTWIGEGTVVRHGAYVRGNCLIGADCCIGHATEVKGSIFLDGAQAPHFNYVGDCILGRGCNLGAGVKLSNLKNDGSEVTVPRPGGGVWRTGRRKLGAVVGDGVQIGCNAVTAPGALIGPGSLVYPNAFVRGVVPARTVVKLRQGQEMAALRGGA